ncbi:ATP-binding protein [Actinomadura rupiterrae]|uniref:ATP-binding protein n=1 Tax=Actinomadura rupiterrae TaxID=559627 RepID=UPI0020A541B8|nr:LuxR C-terminal-related transcriptional regulator [Actinomadura rupiterrae]MCP2342092.1 putative ATPase/DNA-binding CsgD family transcriptional regulator [Actinomadura rupiterrae]
MTQSSGAVTQWGWARSSTRHEPTAFIGRAAELAAVAEAVQHARILTLTGPGGVGKTRIAVRAAHQLATAFPDGVSITELSGLGDGELLPNTVASAVGLPEVAALPPMDQLIEHFADRRALLLLDTCEHLVDAVAMFADILLHNSARLVLLLTSRQPVALPGEVVLAVPPMPMPEPDAQDDANDTVALFLARAKAARPSFRLDEDNRAQVNALCRRLDGMPLAIELAAVRLRTMPLEEILQRIDNRFQVLTGVRSAQARHQTLRATIEWSHELCTPPERELWARLSVFAGGFTLAAVEQVCSGEGLDAPDVVDLLMSLVDKSVVQRLEGGAEQRYRMLDTIREYGAERLRASGRADACARRHLEYFVRLADRAGQEWFGDDQIEWGRRLAADLDNFRMAMGFAIAHPRDDEALLLVNGLWGLWLSTSRLTEGRRWIAKAVDADPRSTLERGKALFLDAYYALLQSDPAAAEALRRCRAAAEGLGDDFLLARTAGLECRAMVMWGEDPDLTVRSYQRAREQMTATQDVFFLAAGYTQTAALFTGQDEPDRALEEVEQGLRLLSHIPHERWLRTYLQSMQVASLWALGEGQRARELGQSVLPSIVEQGHTMGIAAMVEFLAWVAQGEDEPELAATLLGGAAPLWHKVGTITWNEPGMTRLHRDVENGLMRTLGAELFTQNYTRGTHLPLQQLIDLAGGTTHTRPAEPLARDDDPGPLAPLTPRERQVAHLIADGLSNRQIAERLVISKRTADAHVEHIFTKLGFNARSQVATLIGTLKPQ